MSVQRTNGEVVETPSVEEAAETGEPATDPTHAPDAIEAAAAPAPKRRGRPPGTGAKAPKPKAPKVESAATDSIFKVRATLRLRAKGPDGRRIYFDRIIAGSGDSVEEANRAFARRLEVAFKAWEKMYLS